MNFDIKQEFKNVVLRDSILKNTYNKIHPNSKYSLDLIITELFYFLQSGVSWRFLRSSINYKSLFWHFNNFVKHNIFLKLFSRLRNLYFNKFMISHHQTLFLNYSTIYNKFGINKIGRNKFYKNKRCTKLSLLTDIHGFPLSIFFMKGNYHDISVFDKHIRDVCLLFPNKQYKIIADKAYSSNATYSLLNKNNIKHIIPPRKNMKLYNHYSFDSNEYIKRIKIEHIFARFKSFRRLTIRYDKYLRNYSAFVYLAFSFIAINTLKNLSV